MQTHLQFIEFLRAHLGLVKSSLHGLEKESLRVNLDGALSEKKHPIALGAALKHPHYTLDFSEAQLEFVTSPQSSIEKACDEMFKLHQFAYQNLGKEMLWTHSCPCPIEEERKVLLAHFGMTKEAYQKWLYRKGLSLRCGQKMQLLSGVHYSFSFGNEFWNAFQKELGDKNELQSFISESYLSLIRNFLRMGWLCSYLFGSSPALDRSYFKKIERPIELLGTRTGYVPYGTSIRMSHLGYFNKIQNQLGISFNSHKQYLKDLNFALNTKHPFYEKIGVMQNGKQVQINENFLQIEAEHYSRIRPKAYSHIHERPIEALKSGIGYVEMRNIDINPCNPIGIDVEMLYFMQTFFIYCLIKKSPVIHPEQAKLICMNQDNVALFGRRPKLMLRDDHKDQSISLKNWSENIIAEMMPIAELLDSKDKKYSSALNQQIEKINEPNLTPSAKQIERLKFERLEFDEYVVKKSLSCKRSILKENLPKNKQKALVALSFNSIKKLQEEEQSQEDFLSGYEDMEFSTQMVLREAFQRSYKVEIIDRKENIVQITHDQKEILIKQATQTKKDSLISFLAMENKYVTQKLLNKHNISTPQGFLFESAKEAANSYRNFSHQKVVLKPNTANFGEGIAFVEPGSKKVFCQAAREIEKRGDQILVESFFKAKEYRFLVIDGKVVAVAQRIPAHVLGNGKNTVLELVEIKNKLNESKHAFQKPLDLTVSTRALLKDQGFSSKDVPGRNKKVWLRKNSNVSTGGESKDMTDVMPFAYKKIALQATSAVGASICGVDIMIKKITEKPLPSNHVVIELNHNPALFIHRAPTYGQKRYVEKDLLDFLFR
ncbi:MAG: Glutathione biosynthesis bifunctional protein GshAB [Chlamydiae bacterium]|nr:Glutathione biosynthesis bifunctional protein GshAB [Chlamydiota bacterium]